MPTTTAVRWIPQAPCCRSETPAVSVGDGGRAHSPASSRVPAACGHWPHCSENVSPADPCGFPALCSEQAALLVPKLSTEDTLTLCPSAPGVHRGLGPWTVLSGADPGVSGLRALVVALPMPPWCPGTRLTVGVQLPTLLAGRTAGLAGVQV